MKDQHTLIKGYRDLTADDIEQMNQIKSAGNALGALIEALQELDGFDQRFIALGKSDIQKGLAMVIRGIAQPSTFC
jgi:hypothetical protein